MAGIFAKVIVPKKRTGIIKRTRARLK